MADELGVGVRSEQFQLGCPSDHGRYSTVLLPCRDGDPLVTVPVPYLPF